jgi:catechol 2,3-dioxygenase-like lactoylglutathione lyase family enzyme
VIPAPQTDSALFDGVDPVTLCTPEADRAVELYSEGLGFTVASRRRWPADPWRRLWGLPNGGDPWVTDLVKDGAHGGGIRIVEAPELPIVEGGRLPNVCGPYAWDFYVRDMDRAIARIEALGWRFRSEPQRYRLFGQDFDVVECMLEAPQGLLHAFVEYIPDRHRCILGSDPTAQVSEMIALVVVVPEVAPPLQVMVDGMGADIAMDESFSGSQVERLLNLPAGSSFRMALMRGPTRRSARFELLECLIGQDGVSPNHPHVIAPMPVSRLNASIERLAQQGMVVSFRGQFEGGEAARVELAPGVPLVLMSSNGD